MTNNNNKIYLITGSNIGLGLDAARQLALKEETLKVYLACRTKSKALSAIDGLVQQHKISKSKLEFLHFDASASKDAIAKSVMETIPTNEKIDGIVLNAGGLGHDKTGLPQEPNHVMDIVQINLVGHIHLLQALIDNGHLHKPSAGDIAKTTIVWAGSETARGVPIVLIRRPKLPSTLEEYTNYIKGTAYVNKTKKYDGLSVYACVKALGALYFAAWARHADAANDYFVLTVSPGGTSGTNIGNNQAWPKIFQIAQPPFSKFLACIGVFHPVHEGAQRYVDAVTGQDPYSSYASGTFLASKRGLSGPMGDQTKLKAGARLGEKERQDMVYQAFQSCL